MAGTGPFSFAQQQSLAKGVSAAASVTNLPILNQLDVLMKTLTDSAQRDDLKLKALQEISNHFEALAPTAAYPPLMDSLIRAFLKLFNETVPQFIGENNTQQLRKLMLEMTNRMPCNDYLKQYGKAIQQQMFKIIQTENEENVMIALKIVTEHQKQFRPQFSIEVQQFLHFCKGLYRDLPQLLPSIFEPRRNIRVNEIQELHIEQALAQAFCVTPIQTEQKHPDGSPVVYTLLPRGVQSLKVLAELPIVIVLLYQIHRTNVQNDIADFIPLILNMVNLCPSREQRNHPNFNRELFIEFLSAQVKALSFLAFLTRMFHEMVQVHSGSLVQGIMQLLEHCPPEVTHQRRELLMATRHLLGSELRVKFVPHLPKLFNENLMIGSGWTANETLRPLVFSMLADLVHHVRQQLNYVALSSSVHLFSRCIHDPTLPAYVQAMCCKLMLNLVECIVNTTERHPDQSIRELLFYMLEVFIRKFKVVAVQHLPAIMEKHSATNGEEVASKVNGNDAIEKESEPDASPAEPEKRDEEVPEEQKTTAVDSEDAGVGTSDDSSGTIARTAGQVTAVYWGVVAAPMSVHDCRSLVKVLVGGAKTTIWGIGNARVTGDSGKISPEKETELFFRLLRYGIQCLDIYTIMQAAGMPQGTYQRSHPTTSVRSKEEKEALDHFASVFTMLNPMTFKEIFAKNIEFLIDRIAGNYALQLICNSFLVNPLTSAKFGSILVEYLLEKLPEMGVSNDRAVLYLKLFKLVFTSVSCSQSTGCVENEQMLKPHLHRMVHRSMELALKGKEPINYFLLLRALFRSIGGGSHDLLYQEFLPLLPSLLQQLNRLQSGSHKQQMRELFVELCLTVPVRLSSLLPYLPLLMDPLVCALNGSQTLVQQGLRTLELCVDNLQPEYLYEHMAPVRAALMHGLWHTVGSTGDEAASLIAFRILGKFGGSNRKMLSDPQTLTHRTDPEMGGPAIAILYHDMTQTASSVPAADPPPAGSVVAKITMADAVKSAMEHLRSDSAEPAARRESWLYVKALLLAALKPSDRRLLEDDRLSKHLLARLEAIDTSATTPRTSAVYRCSDEASRSMFLDALTAVFFAVVAKDLRSEVLSFFNAIVRQLTLQAIFEQTGGEYSRDPTEQQTHMDGGVLVDAIANALADSSKDFCHSAIVALRFMKDTASAAFGSVEKASKLPLFRHMLDSLCGLCFRHAWYARLGGCTGLQYFLENFPKSLAQENAVTILCAYMEVMVGLSDEVSSGALDMAVHGVELLLKTCFKDGDFPVADRRRLVASILVQVVRRMDSPDQFLRQQCVSVVEQLATLTGETVISVLSLVKKELNDFLDRGQRDFSTMSMASQIGFMDAFAYLHTLDPLLFTFDLDDDSQKCFADALIKLCKTDESVLEKIPTYKSSMGTTTTNNTDLISLKCTAIRAAVACYIAAIQPVTVEMETNAGEDGEDEIRTITDRQQLFLTALKALTHGHAKLQDEAFAALRMAMKRVPMERNVLHAEMRPVLLNLSEYKTLSLNVVKRLLYLTRLSPNTFNEKFCDQILVHLKKWVESALVQQGTAKTTDEIKACEIVLEILHETPAASARFIDVVIPMITKAESQLNLEPGINWRIPLLRYLIRYPLETIQFLVQENNMRVEACRGLFLWLIKQEESGPLRQILTEDPSFINNLLNGQTTANNQDVASEVPLSSLEVLALRLISALSKRDPEWIAKNQHLINRIRSLWNDEKFKARYKSESSDHTKFEAPKLAVKCMLRYFRTNPNDIDLLFDICQCFVGRLSTDFSFVRSFLENEVVATYTVEWRRLAFKRAVDLYVGDYAKSGGPTLIVKILQYVILPCLAFSLEHGDGDKLIGSLPAPDEQNNENLVSLFVSRVIDNQKSKGQLPDGLHIMLYQLSCLFVEFAPQHIHDSSSKKQGSRLRTFMLFAWPCLQQNSQQDPTTKYTGHLLIAHIIDKFAINRKIVLQVFHSLLKAHQQDPRGVIRQALNILTPAVPLRMEDGYLQLMTFAKKIIIEEGHTPAQLFHLLQVIVRHYKVYYHVRHQLTQYLMNGIQKLVTSQGTVENRKLAVDVCEMVIKWELYRLKTSQQSDQPTSVTDPEIAQLLKSPSTSSEQQNGDKKASTSQPQVPENNNPIEKLYVDQVVNILVRMAAQVPEAVGGSSGGQAASVEALNKRSLQLLKVALKTDIWGDVATVKLPWMEKALATADPQTYRDQTQQNFVQSYICLDVLAYLVSILPPAHVVPTIKQCQRGIISCLSCPNSSVVRSLYALITRLLAVTKSSPGGLDDLEMLNQYIAKFVNDSLINYEKMLGSNVASLFGTMTLLKAMCTAHPSYLDRVCLMPFVKTLQKLVREHTTPMQSETVKSAADIISLCLELMRPRLDALPAETRKLVTQSIFLPLIDKSPSARVVSMIIKIVDEWIKNMDKPISALSLLGKLMVNLEKRFGNEKELHKAFLGTVLHVYETPALRTGDVVAKLEPAFHAGLCHPDPEMRAKFFAVFNRTISRNPYERLWHVFCIQNWEPMQRQFWVKQCVNLMLAAVDDPGPVVLEEGATFGRGFEAASGLSAITDFSTTVSEPAVKQEAMDVDQEANGSDAAVLRSLLDKQRRFMLEAADAKMDSLLRPLVELCYADDRLAHRVWLCLFPSVWSGLSEKQRDLLMNEIMPFLASGGHMAQKDSEISVVETFVEAFARCSPPVVIKPNLVKYVGCAHHMWHRAIILLENQAYSIPKFQGVDQAFSQDRPIFQHAERLETLDSLAELYKSLCEMDMWQATWNRRCYFEETSKALAYSQQGFCSQAIKVLENAMDNMQKRLSAPSADTLNTITLPLATEMNLWEEEWIRCTKELNQWDVLKDFANNNAVQDPGLLMECAWRLPNWTLMKEALAQVESCCRPEFYWKTHLYRGMLLVCQPDERSPITVERCVELANQQLISDWRKLPAVVSHSHLPILQAAHLIQELSEAGQVAHSMALAGSAPQPTIINEVKSIVKTWRNRAPTLADPLSHWYDVYNWRLHHYLTMLSVFESWESAQQQALLPIHSCAQCMIQLAKVSRQHGHIPVALECLHKLHTMPNLPTMDGHAKLYQHIKCLLKVADVGTRQGQRQEALYEGLDIIENTNISYFTKDQSARIFALKGALLSKMEKSDEANKAFSASLQMMDSLNLAWALWGDHLEGLFFNDRSERAALNIGLNAVVAFLEAARQENESKSRKHLAKLFWMLKALPLCGEMVEQKMNDVLLKYGLLLPAFNWLPWLPQLVSQLKYRPSHAVAKIISHVAQAYPQQTFYVLRNVLPDNLYSFDADGNDSSLDEDDISDETALSWQEHMVRIVGGMRKQRPTDMKYLDAILREIESLRETWAETALRSCRALLHHCYRLAFEHRHEIQSVLVTKHLATEINAFIDALSLSDSRDHDAPLRATTAAQIRSDLDLSQPSNRRVLAVTHKLTKWIAVFEAKVASMPRYDSISEHSECLSLFSNQMANVEVFSEALTPKPGQYAISISRFMPRFEAIRTASTVARRLSIRGQSGKIYSFVVSKTNADRKDSLVMQLFRMINRFLTKERETSRRLLQYAIPKSLTIGAHCLLLEADESATVLYDVMAATCKQRDMTPIDLINRYYDRMVAASGRASQKLLSDILKDISCPAVLPVNSLKQWMAARFPNATDYFTFRKQISLHLALLSVAEFVLHLSWLNIDEMNVNLSTGQLFSNSFVFDINDKNNELDANRPVPFRLSACLQDFLGWSIDGNLTGAMIATARCLQQRNLPYLLRPILWDVYRSHATAANVEPKELISRVNRAVAAISTRLQNVANFEGAKSQVHTLVLAARQNDNLCRMDPAWHPWF